jgi:hypothetical protein
MRSAADFALPVGGRPRRGRSGMAIVPGSRGSTMGLLLTFWRPEFIVTLRKKQQKNKRNGDVVCGKKQPESSMFM